MRRLCPWVALGLVALLGNVRGQRYPPITDRAFIKQYVDAHNDFRRKVSPSASNMLHMTFDIGLAKIARAWGRRCVWKHNPYRKLHPDLKFRPTGENLWMGQASNAAFSPVAAITAFNNEVQFYDFNSHKCTRVCGHYTQVVWATSYKVGCAAVYCREVDRGSKNNIVILVCNYAPPGNYAGVRPYKSGNPCSECPKGDTCEDKLCKNPQRDKENNSYSSWNPSFPMEIVCDKACIAVAVLRPLSVFLVLAAVYYLKVRYPDLSFNK
ncbi:GLIPR1-like protein 1 [Elgaria multicarinata webbii]|uniref:GLIPR1-like protein 1 n=1 Tax=Elgaria multicarinata webbii TaxID=159646 RepID=UPI002FCCC12A